MNGPNVDDERVPIPTLAELIKALRGNLTQAQFGERAGMSSAMVGHVEANTRSISLDAVERISQAFDLNADQASELRAARDRASKPRPAPDRPVTQSEFQRLVAKVDGLARVVEAELGLELSSLLDDEESTARPDETGPGGVARPAR